jgi:hypothetical protein
LLKQKSNQGRIAPKEQAELVKGELDDFGSQLAAVVQKFLHATWAQYGQYWGKIYNHWIRTSTMDWALQKDRQFGG